MHECGLKLHTKVRVVGGGKMPMSLNRQVPYLVLATKLSIPQSPIHLVKRERLMEKMNRSLHCKLSTVVAPTGFGKSIFVSDWLRSTPVPMKAGWLSLDSGENDLERFWHYVIFSLNKHYPGIGHKALSLMQSLISVSIEHVVALFINDLCAIDDRIVLVWDDYHLIRSEEVHRSVQFFWNECQLMFIFVSSAGRFLRCRLGDCALKAS